MLIKLSDEQSAWFENARSVGKSALAPRAAEVDRSGQYPRDGMNALRDAGLFGMRVAKQYGGGGADLLSTVLAVEELAKHCPSTAMCYKMHIEASEMIARVHTPEQVEKFVKPLARGEALYTVAGGETSGKQGDDWHPAGSFSAAEIMPDAYRLGGMRSG